MMDRSQKMQCLSDKIRELGKVAIGFSGGVDSTFLLKTACDVLGGENVAAITIKSGIHPEWEFKQTLELAEQIAVKHIIIEYDVMNIEGFAENPEDRCYVCKKRLFSKIQETAVKEGFQFILDGSNYDDLGDYRPGMKAAAELKVISPLKECMMTKEDIRYFSKLLNLYTWDKPSFACLASRIPYGQRITEEKLKAVEKAEVYLMNLGFRQVRVRHHGDIARIEIPAGEMRKLFDEQIMADIASDLRSFGFSYVTLDLNGYRTGSLNEVISEAR